MPPRRACDLCYKRKELSHRVEELEDALKSARRASAGVTPRSDIVSPRPSTNNSPYDVMSLTAITGDQPSNTIWTLPTDSIQSQSHSPQACPCDSTHKLSRCQLGNNWYFKGVGILSSRGQEWISYGAGQDIFLEKFEIFDNPVSTKPELVPILPAGSRILPPEFACRHLVGVFLRSKTSLVFPILDKDLIEGTIARAYDTRQNDPRSRTSAEACLWAMFALINRLGEAAPQTNFIPEAKACALESKRLLFVLNGAVNLDCLQANLLLWAYHKMQGRCREASVVFTSACRTVCSLGGHVLLDRLPFAPQHIPTFDQMTTFHIRRLFWICYCFDKDSSIRTGIPPILTEDYCEVSDPGEWINQPPSWYNQSRDLELAKFKEKASRLLCSPRAFRYTEGELLSTVRQLDDELEEWRLSIEPRYRPKLSVPESPSGPWSSDMSLEDRTRSINLQLDYLFTMIYIHITVRKCGDFKQNLPDALHTAVHSSADLSLEASRSIFRFLHAVVDFWKDESVWVVSHYAPVATMPLFVNVLIHPVGNPADDDLQILASISSITRRIPTKGLSKAEIEQIQEVGEFVMELIRLCHSAAWKVKKGDREKDLDIIHE
ncbi:uncharacterized protein E0L32_008949 [Thyridium curvatum]|uniref:Xylanolytic transcriptional activator regulatory domain-containing protein n=1 Tax=Thyridium curvatum TaxID=1093900 RepID=A0A507AR57_9PEZI|nr:uncharacterized protein E0L32_008949 [Thyridium curvatum]TPX09927.1 hypothetical protein E0L32_008949 [Thyridium curvatum]